MKYNKTTRDVLLSNVNRKYAPRKRAKKANYDTWVGNQGEPVEYKKDGRRRAKECADTGGRLSCMIGRHMETVDALKVMWNCSRTEVILRLLRPLYFPIKYSAKYGEKKIGNPYPTVISLDPRDWEDEELNP